MSTDTNNTGLSGRVAVVTGGASGLGLATAIKLSDHGAVVVVNDINDDAALAAVDVIRQRGGTASHISCDIADESAVIAAAQAVVREHRTIDVLVNSAGIAYTKPAEEYDAMERVIGVNLMGTVHWARAAANASMIAQKRGSIVNLSSIAGLSAIPNDIGYVASKHAVVGLTKALAIEWARFGIRVNAVAPGLTDSPMVQDLIRQFPQVMADRVSRIPLARPGVADEQADAIVFLASDQASYVTGAVLVVDGGQHAMSSGRSAPR